MKNTKIILSAILFLSIFGIVSKVNAAGAALSVSPTNVSKVSGEVFNLSVNLVPSGSSVCAVEGTLDFKNLSCQSITLANDVMGGSSLTCANPHFLVGIPNCATADKTLMTVQVRANKVGVAEMTTSAVDIIGNGVSLSNASLGGNYIITTAPVKATVETQVTPTGEINTNPVQDTTSAIIPTTNEGTTQDNNLAASAGKVSGVINWSSPLWIIILVIIVLVLIYGIYKLIKKGKRVETKTEPMKPITPQNQNIKK